MQFVLISVLCFIVTTTASLQDAESCDNTTCSGSDCHCCGTNTLIADAPQLIVLTFEEAVLNNTFTNIWQPLLYDRVNPDGNPIGATFFVPHEYTDYEVVQALYVHGFEIAVNSITRNSTSQYWANSTEETLTNEFQGQRTIISTFANIPIEDIIGARTPQFHLQGDVSINAYITSGLQYDNSWTTRSSTLLWPYTLDYLSCQECLIDIVCPVDAHPDFWIAPIINLIGNSSTECNALNGCGIQGTADEISSWLLEQVVGNGSVSTAPRTIVVPTAWFTSTANSYEAFELFLDALGSLSNVFLVSQKQVIDWMRNPVPADQFQTGVSNRTSDCLSVNCELKNSDGNIRYMRSCVPCPTSYPWIGNPTGE